MADVTGPITWDGTGLRRYELGVDRGVLYPYSSGKYQAGVAWNGLVSVTNSPDGAEAQDFYGDNIKYGSIRSAETFGGNISCYTAPDEFAACNGEVELAKGIRVSQQGRARFGFSYRTMEGDDTMSDPTDYNVHLVYGATASPSEAEYDSINDSPSAMTFSYDFDTTPVSWTGHKAVSHIVISSREVDPVALKKIEDTLYGTTGKAPTLPLPDELVALLAA